MDDIYQRVIDNNAGLLDEDQEGSVADVFTHYSHEAVRELEEPSFRMDVGSGWLFFSGFRENEDAFRRLLDAGMLAPVEEDVEEWGTTAPIRVVMGAKTGQFTKRVLQGIVRDEILDYEEGTMELLHELLSEDLIEFRVMEDRTFHPKIYSFYFSSPYPDDIWAGSANFSSGGLRQNIELCVPMQTTRSSRKQFREWFDALWEQSTPDLNVLETLENVQNADSLYNEPTVFFAKLLKSLNKYYLLEDAPGREKDHLLDFQDLTYTITMNRLQKFGGYILANSVGTGKTYICAQTAATYLRLNPSERVLAVVPANEAVRREWREVLKQFDVWEQVDLRSMGEFQKQNWIDVTDERSEAMTFDEREYADEYSLVIADEAHAYRNDGSNRRQNLEAVIKKNPRADVLLATATPVNLSPYDLFQLIELFRNGQRSKQFAESGIRETYVSALNDLRSLDDYNSFDRDLLERIQTVEQELSIKMTWRVIQSEYEHDLRELAGEDVRYEDPEVDEIRYSFPTSVRREIFDEIVPFLENLNYESAKIWSEDGYQESKNLIFLQKWRLYKQLESSLPAFQEAIRRLYARNKIYHNALSNLHALDDESDFEMDMFEDVYGEIADVLDETGFAAITSSDEQSRRENMVETFSGLSSAEKSQVLEGLRRDVEITERMLDRVDSTAGSDDVPRVGDTKVERLVEIASNAFERDAPVLVFSQHVATVEYLAAVLKAELPEHAEQIEHIHGRTERSKEAFVERFQRGDVDVAISTELLSEGVNMPRADVVVNYDLPYNPTKLVQRAGRALRITNPKRIEIKNFIPDESIDRELDLYDTLDARLDSIVQIAGLDFVVWMMDEKRVETLHDDERSEYFSHLEEYKDRLGRENPEDVANSASPPEETRIDRILRRAVEAHELDQELLESVSEFGDRSKPIYTTLQPVDEDARAEDATDLAVIGQTGGQTRVWTPLQESVDANPDAPERYQGLSDEDFDRLAELEEAERQKLVRQRTAAGTLGRASSRILERVRGAIDDLSNEEMVAVLETVRDGIENDSFTQSDLDAIEAACNTVLEENYSWMKDADEMIRSTSEWAALKELANELHAGETGRATPNATAVIKYQNETMEKR